MILWKKWYLHYMLSDSNISLCQFGISSLIHVKTGLEKRYFTRFQGVVRSRNSKVRNEWARSKHAHYTDYPKVLNRPTIVEPPTTRTGYPISKNILTGRKFPHIPQQLIPLLNHCYNQEILPTVQLTFIFLCDLNSLHLDLSSVDRVGKQLSLPPLFSDALPNTLFNFHHFQYSFFPRLKAVPFLSTFNHRPNFQIYHNMSRSL